MKDKTFLMIPGPTPVPESVMLDIAKHPIGHRSSEFSSILEEVYETLAITPFDKISVPVSTYKSYIDDSIDPNDNKTITVGYIRSYDDRDEVFNIVLFDKYKELANNELHIEPFYNTIYEDGITKLGTIIKLNIIIDDWLYFKGGIKIWWQTKSL